MSHNLNIAGGKARMMYAGEPPWHGLGTRLENPATSAEAIVAAGLDWAVRMVPLFAIEGTGVVPAPSHFAVVPDDRWGQPDCPVFGVVGKDYMPLQNREAFEFFDSIVGQGRAMYHTAGALGQGEHVWILAKLPGQMEVTPSDFLDKYILLSTGHDGRTAFRMLLTPVRVVCQNTLIMAFEAGKEIARAHHVPGMGRQLQFTRAALQALLSGFTSLEAAFRTMAARKLNAMEVQQYVTRVFPAPVGMPEDKIPRWITEDRANCVHLYRYGIGNDNPAVKETLWAAYNGITEYVDHWRTRGNTAHMYNVCFGRGQQIKAAALSHAMQIAEFAGQNA